MFNSSDSLDKHLLTIIFEGLCYSEKTGEKKKNDSLRHFSMLLKRYTLTLFEWNGWALG